MKIKVDYKMDSRTKDYLARYNRNLKQKMFKTKKFYETTILIDVLNTIERRGLPLKAAFQALRFRYDDGHERALTDLDIQQIDTTIEVDEAYHKKNVENDNIRTIAANLKYVIRIDATQDEFTLRENIDEIVDVLERRWKERGCPVPEICDNDWCLNYIKNNNEFYESDQLFIGGNGNDKNRALLNAFDFKTAGHKYESYQQSCFGINDNLMIWMPRDTAELSSKKKNLDFNSNGIGANETWNEYLDDKIIEHINLTAGHKKRNAFVDKMKSFSDELIRIVWKRNKNECGEEGLRYIGNYKFNKIECNEYEATIEWKKCGNSFKKSDLMKRA